MTEQEQIAANEAAQAKAAKDAAAAEAKAKKDEAKKIADAAKAEAKAKADAMKADAKAKKDAEKQAADEAKAKALADKAAAKAAAAAANAETKVKVEMPSQYGVTRPKPDGACGKVWALADQLSGALQRPVSISELITETAKAGLNDATTRTQYARWKTFNGIFGVVAKPVAAAETPAA